MNQRQEKELAHSRSILQDAERIWGRTGRVGESRLSRRAETIVTHCMITQGSKVLEIGCGTGTLTRYLARTGAEVIAIDLFQGFLDLAKTRISAPNVTFQVGEAETLNDFGDASIDVVCGVSILHHLNVPLALRNIFRVLKWDGRIGFSEPNMLNPQIAIQKSIPFIRKWLGDTEDETAFFKWEMRKLLIAFGLREIAVYPFDFLHPSTPDLLTTPVLLFANFLEKVPLVQEIAGSLFIFAKK